MPKGPNGERRPADAVGAAVRVMQIATGEVQDEAPAKRRVFVAVDEPYPQVVPESSTAIE